MDFADPFTIALIVLVAAIAPVPISYAVEALRKAPKPPDRLAWAPGVPVRYIEIDGVKLRYIATGDGPPLVLLHTLRTQLDMFQKIIPALAQHFRIYALDYPGHGFSDIPAMEYGREKFVSAVEGFLEALDIKDAVVAGESIGGTIALLLAARHNARVKKAIAINAYDYDKGRGATRSSLIAKVLFGLNNVPLLGATFWRLRSYPAFVLIMRGGVHDNASLPRDLLRESTPLETARGTTRPSCRSFTTGRSGRRRAANTGGSRGRSCSSTATTTGRGRASGRRTGTPCLAPRW